MTEIIFNERAYAEKVLEEMTLGPKPSETLGHIARYYYNEGYNKNDVCRLLEDFIIKCDPSTSVVKWQALIEAQARFAAKYELIDIDGVRITAGELESINRLKGRMLQRLMFTLLCLAKYGNAVNSKNNNWVNKKDKDIFTLANITVTTNKQSLMINDLWTQGYIGYSNAVDNININVKIVQSEGDTELFITDFRNLGNQYMKYCGEKYIECQCCGLVVKQRNGKQKVCHECAKEIDRQKALERYHRNLCDTEKTKIV